jgi:hypothetical protein
VDTEFDLEAGEAVAGPPQLRGGHYRTRPKRGYRGGITGRKSEGGGYIYLKKKCNFE